MPQPSFRGHCFAPVFIFTVTLSYLIYISSAETLNLSNGDKVPISHDQEEMIKAVKNEVNHYFPKFEVITQCY